MIANSLCVIVFAVCALGFYGLVQLSKIINRAPKTPFEYKWEQAESIGETSVMCLGPGHYYLARIERRTEGTSVVFTGRDRYADFALGDALKQAKKHYTDAV